MGDEDALAARIYVKPPLSLGEFGVRLLKHKVEIGISHQRPKAHPPDELLVGHVSAVYYNKGVWRLGLRLPDGTERFVRDAELLYGIECKGEDRWSTSPDSSGQS